MSRRPRSRAAASTHDRCGQRHRARRGRSCLVARLAAPAQARRQAAHLSRPARLRTAQLDRALGHYRRYPPVADQLLPDAGLHTPDPPRFMNLVGLLGWTFNGYPAPAFCRRQLALFRELMPLFTLEDRFVFRSGSASTPLRTGGVAAATFPGGNASTSVLRLQDVVLRRRRSPRSSKLPWSPVWPTTRLSHRHPAAWGQSGSARLRRRVHWRWWRSAGVVGSLAKLTPLAVLRARSGGEPGRCQRGREVRHRARIAWRWCDAGIVPLWQAPALDRAAVVVAALSVLGLGLAALGPPTDASSLDYHLGLALEWLRHGGVIPGSPDWYPSRLAGIREGKSTCSGSRPRGTDGLGAGLQFGGMIAAGRGAALVRGDAARSRLLAWLLIAAAL